MTRNFTCQSIDYEIRAQTIYNKRFVIELNLKIVKGTGKSQSMVNI